MTCIVGFVDKEKNVYIGGDSAGSSLTDIRVREDVKVFQRGHVIIGYTSSYRMGQLLRFKLNVPKHHKDIDDYEYMCTSFVDSVRKCLKDNGYAVVKDNEEKIGEFLVGYNGKVYKVQSDLQVGMLAENYDACGCGEDYALGSLATNTSNNPKDVVLKALGVAEKFSGAVRKPFKIIRLIKSGD